jgi:hypothetical protein
MKVVGQDRGATVTHEEFMNHKKGKKDIAIHIPETPQRDLINAELKGMEKQKEISDALWRGRITKALERFENLHFKEFGEHSLVGVHYVDYMKLKRELLKEDGGKK